MANQNELEANIEILEAISHQLVLVTSKFCLLSTAFEILIAEGKLDPLDFVSAIQRSDSPEFHAKFRAEISPDFVPSKTIH